MARGWVLALLVGVVAACSGDDAATPDTSGATTVARETVTAPVTTRPVASTAAPPATATATTTVTASAATATVQQLVRPVADPAVCEWRYARDWVADGITLFARSSPDPVPVQVLADPSAGPAGPFALLLRYFSNQGVRDGGEVVDLDGIAHHVRAFENGNGEVEWELADGSIGYVRARGLDRDALVAIAAALTPRPVSAAVPGFDVDPAALPAPFALLHEDVTSRVAGTAHRSSCAVPGTPLEYGISALVGDPIYVYGGVIDRPVPLAVGVVDGTLVVIDGRDDPAALGLDDVIGADEATWAELRTRTASPEGAAGGSVVSIGESVDATLLAFDEDVAASTVALRIVEGADGATLEVDTARAVLDPAAVHWDVVIEGRGGGTTAASSGPVLRYRIGEVPFRGEVNVEVTARDADGRPLQAMFPVRLVVEG